MKIATAPCNWNNGDIPDFRPYTAPGQMMDEMVEAGYTATEWGPGMPDDPAVVRAEMAARGLSMVGAFVRLGYRDREKWDEADAAALAVAERVKAAGGSILVAAELGDDRRDAEAGHVDESRGLTDEQWRNLCDGLAHLADLLEPMGMRVVLHNHVGTYVETAAETKRFLDESDATRVGWCLDVGHLKYGGGDALNWSGSPTAGFSSDSKDWDNQTYYTTTFGQAFTVTPTQVVSVFQTIANGGVRLPASLVESCTEPDGTVVTPDEPDPVQVIKPDTAAQVSQMLENVYAQGTLAQDINIPGYRLAVKTGTAQVPDGAGGYKDGLYMTSLAGFAPADDPQYVVLTLFDEPKTNRMSSANRSVFKKAMMQVLTHYRVMPSNSATPLLPVMY